MAQAQSCSIVCVQTNHLPFLKHPSLPADFPTWKSFLYPKQLLTIQLSSLASGIPSLEVTCLNEPTTNRRFYFFTSSAPLYFETKVKNSLATWPKCKGKVLLKKVDAFLYVGTQLTTFHFSQFDIFYRPRKAFCLGLLFLTMFPKGQLFSFVG